MFREFKTFQDRGDRRPELAAGAVLIKVAGAGACHSDVAIFHEFEPDPNQGLMSPPFVPALFCERPDCAVKVCYRCLRVRSVKPWSTPMITAVVDRSRLRIPGEVG